MNSSNPNLNQILFWDRTMVPVSRVLDPIFMHKLGKSMLAVYKKWRQKRSKVD